MNNSWCTIESDPGVFTELIQNLGVKDVEVNEIFTLEDKEYINSFEEIFGFIFLFKWTPETNKKVTPNFQSPSLFFAEQVIPDACATQAILSILLNNSSKLNLGENLKNFREFSLNLDPYSRGLAIGESDHIRKTHNSFAKPEPFIFQRVKSGPKEDAFHFVSYINYDNCLLELDGLQKGAICHERGLEGNWVDFVKEVIQNRIKLYSGKEIRFNLLAVVKSKGRVLGRKVLEEEKRLVGIIKGLEFLGNKEFSGFEVSSDFDRNSVLKSEINEENVLLLEAKNAIGKVNNLKYQIKEYEIKKDKQKKENRRRKCNYLPLMFELFKKCAEKGKLIDMYKNAKK